MAIVAFLRRKTTSFAAFLWLSRTYAILSVYTISLLIYPSSNRFGQKLQITRIFYPKTTNYVFVYSVFLIERVFLLIKVVMAEVLYLIVGLCQTQVVMNNISNSQVKTNLLLTFLPINLK